MTPVALLSRETVGFGATLLLCGGEREALRDEFVDSLLACRVTDREAVQTRRECGVQPADSSCVEMADNTWPLVPNKADTGHGEQQGEPNRRFGTLNPAIVRRRIDAAARERLRTWQQDSC